MCYYWAVVCVSELGRDALNKTGRFTVVGGIISPVCDAYKKKVRKLWTVDAAPVEKQINPLYLYCGRMVSSTDWSILNTVWWVVLTYVVLWTKRASWCSLNICKFQKYCSVICKFQKYCSVFLECQFLNSFVVMFVLTCLCIHNSCK